VSTTDSEDDIQHYSRVSTLYQRLRLDTFVRLNGSPKWIRSGSWISILRDVIIHLLAFWGLFSIFFQFARTRHFQTQDIVPDAELRPGCDCGDSIAEAISLGCKFDSLSMAWLPEHCRDDELTAEFDIAGDGPNGTWLYFADTEHTELVDAAAVAAMGDDPSARVHMDKTWHRVHCVYYWRKLFRTRFNGKIIEPRSDTEGHVKHCGMVFEKPGYGTISGVALNTNEQVAE
jgi:hypothetical protein